MKTESTAKDAFIVVVALIFLTFIGINVYRTLIPVQWDVECIAKDSHGKVFSTVRAYPSGDIQLERFMREAEKRGEICTKTRSQKLSRRK